MAISLFIVVMLIGGGMVASRKNPPVELASGVTVEWLGLTLGTNDFTFGNPVQKLLKPVLPPAGISIGPLQLRRPLEFRANHNGEEEVTIWLRFRGLQPTHSDFGRGLRLRLANRSGRAIDHPITGPALSIGSLGEYIFGVPLSAFPRDEESINLNLFVRQGQGEEEVARFDFVNPLPARREKWIFASVPGTNMIDGVPFRLSEITRNGAAATLSFTTRPDWTLLEAKMLDEEGNRFTESGRYSRTREWQTAEFDFALERGRPWKVEALFVRADSFPSGTFEYPEEERRNLKISLGTVGLVLTNTASERFLFQYDGKELYIHGENGKERPYWVLLAARDENGKRIGVGGGSGWTQFSGGPKKQTWHIPRPYQTLTLELACPKLVRPVFYVAAP